MTALFASIGIRRCGALFAWVKGGGGGFRSIRVRLQIVEPRSVRLWVHPTDPALVRWVLGESGLCGSATTSQSDRAYEQGATIIQRDR